MPTYLEWDREVLEQCYEYVDGLSLHRYFDNTETTGGDSRALPGDEPRRWTDRSPKSLAVCDLVRGHKRSPKQLWLSFDEWNVWYRERRGDAVDGTAYRSAASARRNLQPRRRAARRRPAQHADSQFRSRENRLPGAIDQRDRADHDQLRRPLPARRFSIPTAGRFNIARGAALECSGGVVDVRSERDATTVPHLDVAGSYDASDGSVVAVHPESRSAKSHDVEIVWEDQAPTRRSKRLRLLTGDDLKAVNSFQSPQRVAPQTFAKPTTTNGRTKFEVPPRCYTMLQWSL